MSKEFSDGMKHQRTRDRNLEAAAAGKESLRAAAERRTRELEANLEKSTARVRELEALINTPELADFVKGVQVEAAHQRERWGKDDAKKTLADWFWTLGYLGQKALYAALAGDLEKARHHTISTAAMCLNWHASLQEPTTTEGK